MELKNKTEIVSFLHKKMMEEISSLMGSYMVYLSDNDEAKKTLQASETMEALMGGKPWPKKEEDINFVEKYKEEWTRIHGYNHDINLLSK